MSDIYEEFVSLATELAEAKAENKRLTVEASKLQSANNTLKDIRTICLANAKASSVSMHRLYKQIEEADEEIESLEAKNERLNTQLHVAAGMLSGMPAFQHKHPEDALKFIIDAAMK